ncbi:lytic polysaccharide monooxygenase [Kitasatospora aburaviensis]
MATGGTAALYDWMSLRIGDAAGRHRELIPDGKLCSAGSDTYRGLDLPRADWPATNLTSGADFTFRYRATAPHKGTFQLYITNGSYSPTKPLTWANLEPQPFLTVTDPQLVDGSYVLPGKVPAGKTGRQLIYAIWQRSDSPEAFYSCSDVVFDGSGANPGTNTGTGGSPVPTGGATATTPTTPTTAGGHDHGHAPAPTAPAPAGGATAPTAAPVPASAGTPAAPAAPATPTTAPTAPTPTAPAPAVPTPTGTAGTPVAAGAAGTTPRRRPPHPTSSRRPARTAPSASSPPSAPPSSSPAPPSPSSTGSAAAGPTPAESGYHHRARVRQRTVAGPPRARPCPGRPGHERRRSRPRRRNPGQSDAA